MQRNLIQVGKEYLVSTSNDWKANGSWRQQHIRIVDTRRWDTIYRYTRRSEDFKDVEAQDGILLHTDAIQTKDGAFMLGVLVDSQGKRVNDRVELVRAAHVRGEWATAKAEVDAVFNAKQERRRKQAEAESAAGDRADALTARFNALLGTTRWLPRSGGSLVIGMDDLEALLSMAEAVDGPPLCTCDSDDVPCGIHDDRPRS